MGLYVIKGKRLFIVDSFAANGHDLSLLWRARELRSSVARTTVRHPGVRLMTEETLSRRTVTDRIHGILEMIAEIRLLPLESREAFSPTEETCGRPNRAFDERSRPSWTWADISSTKASPWESANPRKCFANRQGSVCLHRQNRMFFKEWWGIETALFIFAMR